MYVWLPLMCPPLETWPATQAYGQTGDPLVLRPSLNPMSHTSQSKNFLFLQPSSIPVWKCPIFALSTSVLMDTWTASTSWQL